MIIKEFRIIIPQSVEEYQIGQLYTIQKKSRLESVGAGSGVEIIENKPYESQKEKGQYTLKVYHVDERLPAGLKTLSKLLFPKSALLFEEESWNCYPYTRTKYRHKMFKGFNIDIESKYLPDYGQSDNVFGLSKSELNSRSVEYIDIVNDPINPTEYKPEEDPLTFVSAKTNRGPLPTNWLEELKKNANTKDATTTVNKKPIRYMCSYKLCRIECAIWGCQSRLEKSISESVLRSMIQISHRQAWCWQDEYIDLSIEDVRKLERETQLYLEAKMRNDVNKIDEMENKFNNEKRKKSNASKESGSGGAAGGSELVPSTLNAPSVLLETTNLDQHGRKTSLNKTNSLVGSNPSEYEDIPSANDEDMEYATSARRRRSSAGNNENASNNEFADIYNDDNDSMGGYDSDRNSRYEEFYDAISQASFQELGNNNKPETTTVAHDSPPTGGLTPKIVTGKEQKQQNSKKQDTPNGGGETTSSKRREKLKNQLGLGPTSSLESPTKVEFSISGSVSPKIKDEKVQAHKTATMSSQMSKSSSQSSSAHSSCKVDVLMIVVHGGNVTCTDTSKQGDFANFRTTLDSVIKSNYSSLLNRVAYRLVTCEPICREALIKLAALSPMVNEQAFRWNVADDDDFAEVSAEVFTLHENLPFNTLPLLAMANQSSYRLHVCKLIQECNHVYKEFLQSEEGHLFQGQVAIVGDSLGSLLVYDALTHSNTSSGNGNQLNTHHSSNSNEDVSSLNQSSNSSASQPYTIQPLNRINSNQSNATNNVVSNRPQISIKDSEGNEEMDDEEDEDDDDLPPEDLCMMKGSKNKTKMAGANIAVAGIKRHASMGSAGGGGGGNTTSMFEFSMPYLTPQQQSPVLAQRNMTLPVISPMSGGNNAGALFSQNSPNSPFFSASVDEARFDFDVMHFFVFGSPLGLVLAYKKLSNNFIEAPNCSQIYNLFHLTDPIAVRVEPTLCKQFRFIEPCTIPRYTKFPLGDGANTSLDHFIVKYGNLFETNALIGKHAGADKNNNTVNSLTSLGVNDFTNSYLTPNFDQLKSLQKIMQTKSNWWGENRIDYVLYAPEKLANLPKKSLPYLFHSCFWESNDVASFIVRALFKSDYHSLGQSHATSHGIANDISGKGSGNKEPVEKWQRRMNRVKLRNLSSNHRANDVIVLEDKDQVLAAKFSYGPLDFALSGEQVDIYIASKLNTSTSAASVTTPSSTTSNSANTPPPPLTPTTPAATLITSSTNNSSKTTNNWKHYASGITDSHGRLRYTLPADKRLSLGMYQVKMVVKCDHTSAEFSLAVLPANTEAVVFSIDGSFAANISFSGTDPKVRAGAVDVVRHWQDLGYLIIYITARPDIQHYKVTNWLAQHNFPFGMVYFSDGLSRDPIKQKTETLRNIVKSNSISLQAAYGSAKDVPMYASLGLPSTRIFMIGKPKAKYLNHANVLRDGYASHLTMLQNPNSGLRQAAGNARLFIKKNNLMLRHNTMYSSVTNLNTLLPATSSTHYKSFHQNQGTGGSGGGAFNSNTLSPYTRSASTNQLNNQS